ncbi:MAG: hypothetical protein LBR20_06755 [Propionibacteriaceae bacterium]|jgi:hypothetical protein|nr:hypothetical protein [Propionibacteriaceae bacterium]
MAEQGAVVTQVGVSDANIFTALSPKEASAAFKDANDGDFVNIHSDEETYYRVTTKKYLHINVTGNAVAWIDAPHSVVAGWDQSLVSVITARRTELYDAAVGAVGDGSTLVVRDHARGTALAGGRLFAAEAGELSAFGKSTVTAQGHSRVFLGGDPDGLGEESAVSAYDDALVTFARVVNCAVESFSSRVRVFGNPTRYSEPWHISNVDVSERPDTSVTVRADEQLIDHVPAAVPVGI